MSLLTNRAFNTFTFQNSLPRLPLPNLSDSCALLQEVCGGLFNVKEYAEFIKLINRSFPALQQSQNSIKKYLQANPDSNHINNIWTEGYLQDRKPLLCNYNPFFIFENPNYMLRMSQVILIFSKSYFQFSQAKTFCKVDNHDMFALKIFIL